MAEKRKGFQAGINQKASVERLVGRLRRVNAAIVKLEDVAEKSKGGFFKNTTHEAAVSKIARLRDERVGIIERLGEIQAQIAEVNPSDMQPA